MERRGNSGGARDIADPIPAATSTNEQQDKVKYEDQCGTPRQIPAKEILLERIEAIRSNHIRRLSELDKLQTKIKYADHWALEVAKEVIDSMSQSLY